MLLMAASKQLNVLIAIGMRFHRAATQAVTVQCCSLSLILQSNCSAILRLSISNPS